MTSRKNYNSVIFLTTLSVYLGLVLVGAPAPVLAQAALTSRFEVKDGIEKKDDLDKKPDDEEIGSFFELGLEEAVADFFNDLRALKRQGKYNPDFKKTFTANCAHTFCSEVTGGASIAISQSGEIADALWELHDKIEVSKENGFYKNLYNEFQRDEEFQKGEKTTNCKQIDLALSFSKNELSISLGFSKESSQSAWIFAENLNRTFAVRFDEAKDLLTKQIYGNTKATSENNQVFIVTRLPRGSLDALLTQSAK